MGLFILLLCGCSNTIRLSNAPSDLVLVSLTPNNSDETNYYLKSEIPEPYEYAVSGIEKYKFGFNEAFRNNIETYMMTKFSNVRYGQDLTEKGISIKYKITDLDLDYEFHQDAIDFVGSLVMEKLYGTFIVSIRTAVSVSVYRNSTFVNEKLILTNIEKSGDVGGKSTETLLKEALDDGISKTIIMIDKYLTSLSI